MIVSRFAWVGRPFGDEPSRVLKTATPVVVLGILVGLAIASIQSLNAVFVLAAVIAAAIVLWALANPARGFYLALVFLPFVELGKRLLFLSGRVSQAQYLAIKVVPDVVVLVALISYLHRDFILRREPLASTAIDKLVLLFLAWNVAEVFNPQSSLLVGAGGFDYTGVPIALYFLTRSVVRSPKDVRRIGYILVSTGAIAALYGLKQEFFGLAQFEVDWLNSGLTSLGLVYIESAGLLRAFSTFASHKEFGFYLVTCAGFIAILQSRHRWPIFLAPLILAGLTVTWARDAWSCGFGVILALLFFHRKPGRLAQIGVLAVLYLSPVLVPTLGGSVIATFADAGRYTADPALRAALVAGTYGSRLDGWHEFLTHPLDFINPIGHGIGSLFVGSRFGDQFTLGVQPHSGPLEMAYELGAVGLLIFLALWAYAWVVLGDKCNTADDPEIRLDLRVFLAIQFGILVPDMLIGYSFVLHPAVVYFWVTLGSAVSLAFPTVNSRTIPTTASVVERIQAMAAEAQ